LVKGDDVLRLPLVLTIGWIAVGALAGHPGPPSQFPPAGPGPAPVPTVRPGQPELTPIPTPPVNFHDGLRPGFDAPQEFDQNHDSKPPVTPAPDSTAPAAPASKGKQVALNPQATPDIEALGTLLDRLSLDQDALRQVLAGRPSLDDLNSSELAKAESILSDQDLAEQLLQARLQTAPLPVPKTTPSSARPLATPTPIP
jgi:hypothetical protein